MIRKNRVEPDEGDERPWGVVAEASGDEPVHAPSPAGASPAGAGVGPSWYGADRASPE